MMTFVLAKHCVDLGRVEKYMVFIFFWIFNSIYSSFHVCVNKILYTGMR